MTTVVVALPFPALTRPPGTAEGEAEGDAEGDAEGATAGPPETHVTVAVPDRLSETRFTRATPSFVWPWGSTRPRVVKHWTTVPSGHGIPAGSMQKAEITDTPPLAAMKGGLAKSVSVDPGGAVRSALAQVRGARARSRTPSHIAALPAGRLTA